MQQLLAARTLAACSQQLLARSALSVAACQGGSTLLAASLSSRAGAFHSSTQQQHAQQHGAWWGSSSSRSLWPAGAAAGAAAAALLTTSSTSVLADATAAQPGAVAPPSDPYALPPGVSGRLPSSITLYQYEVCPFCCKVKAFLDFHKLPYSTVEVNPITKGELSSWSEYRKVPVVKLDGEVVADSSAIMSRLAAELNAAGGKGGWLKKGAQQQQQQAEETRWRKWVDERFVKVLTANIYRTWDESWATTSYMAEQSSWSWGVRQGVRVAGALLMWGIGQRMPKKYNITGDLREALYVDANTWVDALPPKQPFMGGAAPNLADLSLFGVIEAIRGTPTYIDLLAHSRISPWYERMAAAVGPSARVAHT